MSSWTVLPPPSSKTVPEESDITTEQTWQRHQEGQMTTDRKIPVPSTQDTLLFTAIGVNLRQQLDLFSQKPKLQDFK